MLTMFDRPRIPRCFSNCFIHFGARAYARPTVNGVVQRCSKRRSFLRRTVTSTTRCSTTDHDSYSAPVGILPDERPHGIEVRDLRPDLAHLDLVAVVDR